MLHLSDKVAPENLSLAGEFSYYVLDNALKWPYLMGYLLLAAIVLIGIFKSRWMDKLWLGALIIGLICLLIFVAGLVMALVFSVIFGVLFVLDAPPVVAWNVAFIMTIGVVIVIAMHESRPKKLPF